MKTLVFAIAILFGSISAASAQTGPAGTWQAQGAPWVIELKTDPGGALTGTVTQNNGVGFDIVDGKTDGNTVSFKLKSPSGAGVITFTGKLNGDEMSFTREAVFSAPAGNGDGGLLGPGEPTQFVVNRLSADAVWNGTLRNAPTKRNPTPNPNPRPVMLGTKKVPTPQWRWRGGDKQVEVRTITMPSGSYELSTFELTDDHLSYSFIRPNQDDELQCDLKRQPDGKFSGMCAGVNGGPNQQLIELTPPGVVPQK